ncbi:hypothetical protein [Nitrospirillum viridazoti]|uniref:hypothetical protein n=1 Tax=Nitrospirillum viridazoti TaxID=3144925 RepID=UPI00110F7A67|nr:hypothetical protein [Nitrospirillum amazonense]
MSSKRDVINEIESCCVRLSIRQTTLAHALQISQGHLSKVLKRRVNLTLKMERKLRAWLEAGTTQPTTIDNELQQIIDRLMAAPTARRMQIMHLLKAIDGLAK